MSDSEQLKNTAKTLIEEGKAAYDSKYYDESVSRLGEACQLLDEVNGDLAPENGDAYFLYGKALLQLAIQQNSVLGQSAQASASKVEEQLAVTKEQEVESKNPLFQLNAIPDFSSNVEDDDDDDDDEEGAGENAEDDFETAWDILDVARIIFEKSEDKETKLKLADVHLYLGDVSLETEKFNEALVDYEKAIEIKQSILKDDNRELAEAHYKYALALEFSTEKSDQAVPELKKAVNVLKKRLEFLESDENIKGKGKEMDLSQEASSEIKEIKELIPDIELKIEELSNRQATEKEAEALLKAMLNQNNNNILTKEISASTPVNDLTTLVKRKKAPAAKEDDNNKKQKLE
ncbi:uncharacterized protein BX663DRAFT_533892 [Cokeromyces recurvatus]|uniref:uncharacterized protein n=1 Tax=Cokeromyces recurvatus TaxID=90255 RepID=UPI002220C0EA|nr:uncharacterized protein BX663DRAFT_533892 [Cokeromyces recurvatus]KAI7907562.1 hypothetical protein BX663DRAFT_533892 [Cokeromyces recurvatus]